MVLTAGFTPDETLKQIITSANSTTNIKRFISVVLNSDENKLIFSNSIDSTGQTDDSEFDSNIDNILTPNTPQYILYQKDDKLWLQIMYMPESSKVRQKMLYASSSASLKLAFGSTNISQEIHLSQQSEFTWENLFKNHIDKSDKTSMLSDREVVKNQLLVNEEETRREMIKEGGGSSSGSLSFGLDEEAITATKNEYLTNQANFLHYKLNIKNEIIELNECSSVNVQDLESKIDTKTAGFYLYKFNFSENVKSDIFFMCMPSEANLKVKEKMLNASCKNGVSATLNELGVSIDHNMEIDSPDEVSEAELIKLINPEEEKEITFVKKARPQNNRRPATRNKAVL